MHSCPPLGQGGARGGPAECGITAHTCTDGDAPVGEAWAMCSQTLQGKLWGCTSCRIPAGVSAQALAWAELASAPGQLVASVVSAGGFVVSLRERKRGWLEIQSDAAMPTLGAPTQSGERLWRECSPPGVRSGARHFQAVLLRGVSRRISCKGPQYSHSVPVSHAQPPHPAPLRPLAAPPGACLLAVSGTAGATAQPTRVLRRFTHCTQPQWQPRHP